MQIKLLVLLTFTTLTLTAFASDPATQASSESEQVLVQQEVKAEAQIAALSDPANTSDPSDPSDPSSDPSDPSDPKAKAVAKPEAQVLESSSGNGKSNISISSESEAEVKDLDAIEAEANKLERIGKGQEKQAKKLEDKAEKLSHKSEKFEGKSEQAAKNSDELEDESKKNIELAEKLQKEVEESPFKAVREESIKKMCESQVSKKKLLKMFDKRTEEQKLNDCIANYKESDLKAKNKVKKAYLGKQCTFNPGISIECPEGTYKFIGSDGLASVNGEDRAQKKEVTGENTESKETSPSAAQK